MRCQFESMTIDNFGFIEDIPTFDNLNWALMVIQQCHSTSAGSMPLGSRKF